MVEKKNETTDDEYGEDGRKARMVEKKNETTDDEYGEDVAPLLPTYDFAANGGVFVGKIIDRRLVEDVIGLDGTPRPVPLFEVETAADGERFVIWGSGMLSRVLPPLVAGSGMPDAGKVVKITDKGKEDIEGGRSLRVYEVRVKK